MKSSCKVCESPSRGVIEAELAAGKSVPLLAQSWAIAAATLRLHAREHVRALALKTKIDPMSQLQDLIDFKSDLELRMGLGSYRLVEMEGEDVARASLPNVKEYGILGSLYLSTMKDIAKYTGANIPRDPKDSIPLFGKIMEKFTEWAQKQSPELRDEIYLLLESLEKEAG